jgi:hypothetical protein
MRLLLAYARDRLLSAPVTAAIVLVAVGCQVVRSDTALLVARDVILATLFVYAFRIWDDLADRNRDRREHPERVTVRTASITPLALSAIALWSGGAVLTFIASDVRTTLVLVTYTIALGAWYLTRRSVTGLGLHLILVKYAAIAIVIMGYERAVTPRGASVAAVIYLAVCIYEWAHDGAAPAVGGVR